MSSSVVLMLLFLIPQGYITTMVPDLQTCIKLVESASLTRNGDDYRFARHGVCVTTDGERHEFNNHGLGWVVVNKSNSK